MATPTSALGWLMMREAFIADMAAGRFGRLQVPGWRRRPRTGDMVQMLDDFCIPDDPPKVFRWEG